jgi:hypothetical protein
MNKNDKNQELLSPENNIAGTLLDWVLAMVIVLIVKRPGLPRNRG